VSIPALGSTQPHVQWVTGVLSPGLKRGLGMMLTIQPHPLPRLRMSKSYTSSPTSAFAVCSGTALAFNKHILESDSEVKAVWKIVKKETDKVSTEVAPSITIYDNVIRNHKLTIYSFSTHSLNSYRKNEQLYNNLNNRRRNKVLY
jgi:hypothetical protein